jgi:hypothetical protein
MFTKLFSFLSRLRTARAECLNHITIVMYTRQGCHLCDEAWERLKQQQRRYCFSLETKDVDADPTLAAKYGAWVPVVTVNGQVRFWGRVNAVLLKRLLEKEANIK